MRFRNFFCHFFRDEIELCQLLSFFLECISKSSKDNISEIVETVKQENIEQSILEFGSKSLSCLLLRIVLFFYSACCWTVGRVKKMREGAHNPASVQFLGGF